MGFGEATRTCLQKYATFSGRASRAEFWWFVLALVLASAAALLIDVTIFGPTIVEHTAVVFRPGRGLVTETGEALRYGTGPASQVLQLATALPLLAAASRRMHDGGRPAWLLYVPWGATAALLAASLLVSGLGIVAAMAGLGSIVLSLAWLTHPADAGPGPRGAHSHEVSP